MDIFAKKSIAKGSVEISGSKSVSHRLLICAALAHGKSIIDNLSPCDDVKATMECLKALGAEIEYIGKNKVTVNGFDNKKTVKNKVLYCNESASTARFLIPLALIFGEEIVIKGKKSLMERPFDIYESFGFIKEKNGDSIILQGDLRANEYNIVKNISSQFVSGLMFALPILPYDSKIILPNDIESKSYINMTINCMNSFGVYVDFFENTISIKGNQTYKQCSCVAESDYSSSAYISLYNCIGGKVTLKGKFDSCNQGDAVFGRLFDKLSSSYSEIDISDCPDLGPALMSVAALYHGCTLKGTHRLRYKESDRCGCMAEELLKFGIDVIIKEDEVKVLSKKLKKPTVPISSHNDHRIAMAIIPLLSYTSGMIDNIECISKSYPSYIDDIKSLGIEFEINI